MAKKVSKEAETFARIRVVGVGGSGGNAVNHMINEGVRGIEFITINTDSQDLQNSLADTKINIGRSVTHGLGTGMNPDLGKKAAEASANEIQEALKGADMVFIACGMGGGTGTGAAPIVAKIAKELGILTTAVVTKPFSFEGKQRKKYADSGIDSLSHDIDSYVIIPNDNIFGIAEQQTTLKTAFGLCDDILLKAVTGISDLITVPGLINIDFADVKAILSQSGIALLGIGNASGESRAEKAAEKAIKSPLLEVSIDGAKRLIFSIASATSNDLHMQEVQRAAEYITSSIDDDAKIIFGTTVDKKLKKGEIRITVIATGFPHKQQIIQSLTGNSIRKRTEDDEVEEVIKVKTVSGKSKDEGGDEEEDDGKWGLSFLKKK